MMKDNMTPQERGEWFAIQGLKWTVGIIVVLCLMISC
jgi:hypothetical protein